MKKNINQHKSTDFELFTYWLTHTQTHTDTHTHKPMIIKNKHMKSKKKEQKNQNHKNQHLIFEHTNNRTTLSSPTYTQTHTFSYLNKAENEHNK